MMMFRIARPPSAYPATTVELDQHDDLLGCPAEMQTRGRGNALQHEGDCGGHATIRPKIKQYRKAGRGRVTPRQQRRGPSAAGDLSPRPPNPLPASFSRSAVLLSSDAFASRPLLRQLGWGRGSIPSRSDINREG